MGKAKEAYVTIPTTYQWDWKIAYLYCGTRNKNEKWIFTSWRKYNELKCLQNLTK